MVTPYQVVKDFETALCEYTGAPYAVTVTSCTMALWISLEYMRYTKGWAQVSIPKRTYCSVPQVIKRSGHRIEYRDEDWIGAYQLEPFEIWDSARWFSSGLFDRISPGREKYICCSFHWSKTLSIGQGGVILHNNPKADQFFRKMRFDGRTEGVAPKDDDFDILGLHCYMSPRDAAEGLSRLALLPMINNPLPNDPYPDLSQFEVFR